MKLLHLLHICCFGAQYLTLSRAQTFTYTSQNAQGSDVVKTGVADNPLPTVRYACGLLKPIRTNRRSSGTTVKIFKVFAAIFT